MSIPYDVEIINELCKRVSCGEYVSKICEAPGMPPKSTFYYWLVKYPEVREKYESARLNRIETKEEEFRELIEKSPSDKGSLKKLELQLKVEMWMMEKINPLKYGQKTTLQGDKNNPITISVASALDERIAARNARKTIDNVPADAIRLPIQDAITIDE